jgi:hypothetical protein
MTEILPSFFNDAALDDVANRIIELDTQHNLALVRAHNEIQSAFQRRWEIGRLVNENYDIIIAKCKSQKAFAEGFGYSESVISNNLRAYRSLSDIGCTTWPAVLRELEKRQINATVQNFERLPALIAGDIKPKDTRQYDERRLEQLHEEVETILRRSETSNRNEIAVVAEELSDRIEQAKGHITKLDPTKYVWKNEKYLEFVRRLGYDCVTGAPCDRPDPHHTLPNGVSATGGKVADVWTIPVSRETHDMIETGLLVLSPDEIKDELLKVMALFIMNHLPNQK